MEVTREGHLEGALYTMAYLCKKYSLRMLKPIPPDTLRSRGQEVALCLFIESNYAVDKLTRRSRSRFVVYMNTALIQ